MGLLNLGHMQALHGMSSSFKLADCLENVTVRFAIYVMVLQIGDPDIDPQIL